MSLALQYGVAIVQAIYILAVAVLIRWTFTRHKASSFHENMKVHWNKVLYCKAFNRRYGDYEYGKVINDLKLRYLSDLESCYSKVLWRGFFGLNLVKAYPPYVRKIYAKDRWKNRSADKLTARRIEFYSRRKPIKRIKSWPLNLSMRVNWYYTRMGIAYLRRADPPLYMRYFHILM